MTNIDLQNLQYRMKFDAVSMAVTSGIDYEQYRRYYYGKTPIPAHHERALLEAEQVQKEFDVVRCNEAQRVLDQMYPYGIVSEL